MYRFDSTKDEEEEGWRWFHDEIGLQKPIPDPAIFNVDKENVKTALLLRPKLAVANPIKIWNKNRDTEVLLQTTS